MTTPTEQSIRKAFEEAGADYRPDWERYTGTAFGGFILALARRIEADGVPVAWMYTHGSTDHKVPWLTIERDLPFAALVDTVETPLYAHPQPDRVKELEAALREVQGWIEVERSWAETVEIGQWIHRANKVKQALKGSTDA